MKFSTTDADAWFERNREKLGKRDPISDQMQILRICPTSVLEIGCSNGWRLAKLRFAHQCDVAGIEPSISAVNDARLANLQNVHIGTADSLPFANAIFDTVIFGFCLYLTDPSDYFRIAAEADRVLRDGGYLIIHDFADSSPHKRRYAHRDGIWCYHMDFSRLWESHPFYHVARYKMIGEECVTILHKNMSSSFPVRL